MLEVVEKTGVDNNVRLAHATSYVIFLCIESKHVLVIVFVILSQSEAARVPLIGKLFFVLLRHS
jgi:hypothetical protein